MAVLEDRCVLSTLTVTSSADDGSQNHTLRYAVAHAQSGDTILLTAAVKGPIVLTEGELILSRDVTIESVPSRTPTISGGGSSRVFEVAAGTDVSLINIQISGGNGLADNMAGATFTDGNGGAILNFGTLTISGCNISGNSGTATSANGFNAFGGAILNDGGAVTVTNCTLTNNSAVNGGAIADFGSLTVSGSTLSGNSAGLGGAISITGAATVTGSTISNNSAGGVGGGVFFFSGTLALSGSTLSGDTSSLGGAIVNQFGAMTITSSSFVNDSASAGGGAMFLFGASTTFVTNSAFSGDTAAFGGAISNAGYLQISGSDFTGNTALSFSGGGIDSIGVVVVDSTTFINNSAATFGGGISSAGSVFVTNDAFAGNSAALGGAIANFAFLSVGGSNFSGNSPDDIFGGYIDLGGNSSIIV